MWRAAKLLSGSGSVRTGDEAVAELSREGLRLLWFGLHVQRTDGRERLSPADSVHKFARPAGGHSDGLWPYFSGSYLVACVHAAAALFRRLGSVRALLCHRWHSKIWHDEHVCLPAAAPAHPRAEGQGTALHPNPNLNPNPNPNPNANPTSNPYPDPNPNPNLTLILKELRVFTPIVFPRAGRNLTLEKYTQLFPAIRPGDGLVTGEASPAYFYSLMAAQFFARQARSVQIIVLLRHPVGRWLSEYSHRRAPVRADPRWMVSPTFGEMVDRAHEALFGRNRCQRNESVCIGTGAPRRAMCCVSPITYNSWYDLFWPRWAPRAAEGRLHIAFTEDLNRDSHGALDRLTSFLGLPGHAYNTTAILNHHQHYDFSGKGTSAITNAAASSDVLCDEPRVLRRAQQLMLPGVFALSRQLRPLGLAPPTEWWLPLRCASNSSAGQLGGGANSTASATGARSGPQMRMAVLLTGQIRSFVVPAVWQSIGSAVYGLCARAHCALELFLCPSELPVAGGASEREWLAAASGLGEMLRPHCLGGSCNARSRLATAATGATSPLAGSDPSGDGLGHGSGDDIGESCSGSGHASQFMKDRKGAVIRWQCHRAMVIAERAHGSPFAWVAVLRFDVAYFGPLPAIASLPRGVIVPANHGKGFGTSNSSGWLSDHFALASRGAAARYCYHPCEVAWYNAREGRPMFRMAAETELEAQLSATTTPVHLRYVPWVIVRRLDQSDRKYAAECFRHTPCCVRPTSDAQNSPGLLALLNASSARRTTACHQPAIISAGPRLGGDASEAYLLPQPPPRRGPAEMLAGWWQAVVRRAEDAFGLADGLGSHPLASLTDPEPMRCPPERQQSCAQQFRNDSSVTICTTKQKCTALILRHSRRACGGSFPNGNANATNGNATRECGDVILTPLPRYALPIEQRWE